MKEPKRDNRQWVPAEMPTQMLSARQAAGRADRPAAAGGSTWGYPQIRSRVGSAVTGS
jgi:hypothetical protein